MLARFLDLSLQEFFIDTVRADMQAGVGFGCCGCAHVRDSPVRKVLNGRQFLPFAEELLFSGLSRRVICADMRYYVD